MNLIEQLGGYGAAKNFLGEVSNNKSPNEILNRELLEYRRQHNIFEVGDWVVHIEDPEKQSVMTVFDENDLDVWVNDGFRITRCNLRHATPEEIAAGRRLP